MNHRGFHKCIHTSQGSVSVHVEEIKVFWKKFKGNILVTTETKALLPYVGKKKGRLNRLNEHLPF